MASKRSGFEAWVNMAQSLTLSATVILVAPFGLVLTCIALLVQPIALLPLPLYLLRLYSGMSTQTILLAPLVPLCGAALMAAIVYCARPLVHSLSLPKFQLCCCSWDWARQFTLSPANLHASSVQATLDTPIREMKPL